MTRLEEMLEKVERGEALEGDEKIKQAAERAVERTTDLSKSEQFRRWVRSVVEWVIDPSDGEV